MWDGWGVRGRPSFWYLEKVRPFSLELRANWALGAAQGRERARGHGERQVAEKGTLVRRAVVSRAGRVYGGRGAAAREPGGGRWDAAGGAGGAVAVIGFVRVACGMQPSGRDGHAQVGGGGLG